MDSKKCEKCGEIVAAVKAFCLNCGHALAPEETRSSSSEFESTAGTVQYSNSMFNQLLSEMDLRTSEAPNRKDVAPVQALSPAADQKAKPGVTTLESKSRKTFLIIGGIALLVIAFLTMILLIAGIFLFLNVDRLSPDVG